MVTGLVSTYDLTVGVIVDMEDMIHMLDPFDVPLLGTAGADGRTTLSKGTTFEKKFEWLDETLLTPRDALNGALTTGQTVVTVDDRLKFTTDDLVLINAEYIHVSAYGTTANTLIVVRGYDSSTATNHSDNDVVVGVGTILQEGSDPKEARSVDRSARHNFTQIFGPHKVEVSATENVVRKYGLRGTREFDHQVANRMREVGVAIEQMLLYGRRAEDTTNKRRSSGGFTQFITTNVDTTTTDLTEAALLDELETCFNAGGSPDRFVVGAKQKRKVSAFSETNIRYDRTNETRGQVVEFFDSDFGRISIHLDRWVRLEDGFIFNRDQAEVVTLRPLTFEMLGKTGDAIKGQIVCEKGLKFRRDKHAARFSALEA